MTDDVKRLLSPVISELKNIGGRALEGAADVVLEDVADRLAAVGERIHNARRRMYTRRTRVRF